MSHVIQAIRGMNDLLPEALEIWQGFEASARSVLSSYGYREIRTPLVEKTELFARSIGQATDIVEKEMYSFDDRNGDSLTLRPEGTASCVRAGIQHGLLHNQSQRLWYSGPMFRHERPQKGRYRQFHQIGVETFGMAGPDIDAELIMMSARLWKRVGLENVLRLELNTLGTAESRKKHRHVLVDYFNQHKHALDDDSLTRLEKNPLRILDSKNSDVQALVKSAPRLMDYMDTASLDHYNGLKTMLDAAGIKYSENPYLVRGLDYYAHSVFEWTTDQLGAQNAVCAGGRFDGLVEQLGGKATPAAGFAIGLERLVALLSLAGKTDRVAPVQVYLVLLGESAISSGLVLAERLRDNGYRLQCHCGGGSMKSQMKKADVSGASIALLIGDDEIANATVGIKYLRDKKPQQSVARDGLDALLANLKL